MNTRHWQELQQQLKRVLARDIGDLQVKEIPGGDINRAWRVSDGRSDFFVKVNEARLLPMFEAEQLALTVIRKTNTIRTPRPILCAPIDNYVFLVMEYIDLRPAPDTGLLAQKLAALHLQQNSRYGFDCNNTIGSTPQNNAFTSSWVEFWQQHRLGAQLELAKSNGFSSRLIDSGLKLNQRVADFFTTYNPEASLLHGDLWSGNYAGDSQGSPVIYDPASYYGDHETDLAMMELFGSPGEKFFASYRELFPIDDGYAVRRELYNLYHILNHANLFAGGYASQAQTMIDRLLSEV